jgi:hypothetical protein
MGHDLPRAVWPQIIDAIVENAARATAAEMSATAPAAGAPAPSVASA